MSSGGCYFACCCAVLYLLVQSTSTGELEIDTVACSTVRACASARLCQYQCATCDGAHTVLLSRLFLSNTAEYI